MKTKPDILRSLARPVKLLGGFTALIRPVEPVDGPRLVAGLRALSPESRRRRFLFSKGDYSKAELNYFTHCDEVHHIALVLVETNPKGREGQFVAVGRSIQDDDDLSSAEVAIAVADKWQQHGVGEMLMKALVEVAWEAGIRTWHAFLFSDNVAMRKLLDLVGQKQATHSEGDGVIKLVYHLSRPAGISKDGPKQSDDSDLTQSSDENAHESMLTFPGGVPPCRRGGKLAR